MVNAPVDDDVAPAAREGGLRVRRAELQRVAGGGGGGGVAE